MHRLEITSRMAPQATFKAFRPIYNDDIYTYDMQNIAVDLEDRTLVSYTLWQRGLWSIAFGDTKLGRLF
mgnify:CR=1 FL=1